MLALIFVMSVFLSVDSLANRKESARIVMEEDLAEVENEAQVMLQGAIVTAISAVTELTLEIVMATAIITVDHAKSKIRDQLKDLQILVRVLGLSV